MISQQMQALGFAQATVALTAHNLTGFGVTIPAGATRMLVRCETVSMRWRDDGVAPTTAVGMIMQTTDPVLEYSGNLSAIQFIATATSGVLDISFYGAVG